MFTKIVILTAISLISIAAAMTLNDTDNNAVVATVTTIEKIAMEQADAVQIVTATQTPASLCATEAVKAVYFNADLWRNIRSYLEMDYRFSSILHRNGVRISNARLSMLLDLNRSDGYKAYFLSPHLIIDNFSSLTNSHLTALSVNPFFDTVNIKTVGISLASLSAGLEALKNSLYPRKITLSGSISFESSWTESFQTIDGKRVHSNANINIPFFPQVQVVHPSWPPHGYRVGANGELISNYEYEWVKLTNPIQNPNIKEIYHSSLIRNSILTPEIVYERPKFDILATLATLPTYELKPLNIQFSYKEFEIITNPVELSVSEIYMESTKKFSVFYLKNTISGFCPEFDISATLATLPTYEFKPLNIQFFYKEFEIMTNPVELNVSEIYVESTKKFSVFSLKIR